MQPPAVFGPRARGLRESQIHARIAFVLGRSAFGHLTGYEDMNDAERLRRDLTSSA
jgi:hypothetical protein